MITATALQFSCCLREGNCVEISPCDTFDEFEVVDFICQRYSCESEVKGDAVLFIDASKRLDVWLN